MGSRFGKPNQLRLPDITYKGNIGSMVPAARGDTRDFASSA